MKKILLVVLLLCSNLYAISGFTYWWNVNVSKDTVTAVKLKNNYDSIKNWATRISDTLNRAVVHFSPGSLNKTNVVKYVNIDTIRSNPNIDSISGSPYINAITTDTIGVSGGLYTARLHTPSAGITAANIDTLHNRHSTADSATIPVLKGHTTKRDSTTFTGGIRGVRLSMDSIFNLTGTAGYVQYLSNSKKLINAPIYTNGTNVAIGKSSVENWSSIQKALQVGGTLALIGVATEDNGANYLSTNAYFDGAWKPLIDGGSCMYRQSTNADHLWYSNIGLTSNTAYSPIITMSLSAGGVLNLQSLTAARVLVTDTSKNIVSSPVTRTELGYLSGKNSVIDGSGTTGYVPYFTGAQRLGNSPIYTNGTNIGIGITNPVEILDVRGRHRVQNEHNILWEDVNAVAGSANAWNINSSIKLITNYNQLGFFVSSETNDRRAFIQVGHSLGGYSNALGDLFLNPFGGSVSIGINKEKPVYTFQVTGTTQISSTLNLPSLTASRAVITDGSKNIISSATTSTELGYLSGKNSVIDGSGTAGNLALFSGENRIGNGPAYNSGTGTITGNITGKADTARAAGTATNVSGGTASVTSLTLNGGSQLTAFSKGTFVCSLYVNNNTEFVGYGTVQYQVVDSVVTLRFPYISGTITTSGTNAVNVRNVPVALRSSKTEQYVPVTTYENGGYGIGLFQAKSSSTYFAFTTSAVGSPATGTFTVNRCVVQYFL